MELENTSPEELLYQNKLIKANDPEHKDFEEEEPDEPELESDEEVIKAFQANFPKATSFWLPIYDKIAKDWDNFNLDQWSTASKKARAGRPILTIDNGRKFVKAIVAESFINSPSIKLDSRSDDYNEKAKVLNDAIRYIESNSGASSVRSWAQQCNAVGGLGWVKHSFEKDDQQESSATIKIIKVEDPLSIVMDPDGGIDGSNAMYMIEMHTDKNNTYWWIDEYSRIQWALIKDDKIIERDVWVGSEIPLFPVMGEYSRIRDKVNLFGVMRPIADNQNAINFSISEALERLALTPKSPTYAAKGSLDDENRANVIKSATEPVALIEYDSVDSNADSGNPLPAPMRQNTTPDVAWVVPFVQMLQNNMKEITGIYNTALGDQVGGGDSGVAIQMREKQGDRGHLVYAEHQQLTTRREGRSLLSMIPNVMSTNDMIPVLSEEGVASIVRIGEPTYSIDPQTGLQVEGPPLIEDLDPSDLEINISTGKSFGTRKEEGIEFIQKSMAFMLPEQVTKILPELMMDIDFPNADKYSDILNPGQGGEFNPAMIQQQMAEKDAQMQQMMQKMQELQNQNMQLSITLQHNTDAKIATEQMGNDTDLRKKQMELDADAIQKQLDRELEYFKIQQTTDSKDMQTIQKAHSDSANILADQMKHSQDLQAKAESENKAIVNETRKFQEERIDRIGDIGMNQE